MLGGLDDAGDAEGTQFRRRILDTLDLVAKVGQGVQDRGQAGVGLQMVAQPGQGEFHG